MWGWLDSFHFPTLKDIFFFAPGLFALVEISYKKNSRECSSN